MPRKLRTYFEIADDMERRIRGGEWEPGERLETYRELAKFYGIGYTTIAKAMGLLRDRGLVEGMPGIGVYVADELPR